MAKMEKEQKEKKDKLRFTCVSKKGIEKMVMPAAFCGPEGEEALRDEMAQVVADGGCLYLFCVKKEPVGYLLFEKTRIELPKKETNASGQHTEESTAAGGTEPDAQEDAGPHTGEEKAGNGEAKEPCQVQAYRLLRRSLPPEYEESAQLLEKGILEDLKERAEWSECKVIVWGENLYRRDGAKWGIFAGWGMGLALGLIYGMLFDNVAIGICFGISLGTCFGAAWTMVGQKK